MKIIDLPSDNENAISQAAMVLQLAFRHHWPSAWQTIDEARIEVLESLKEGRLSRIAIDDHENVLGWAGAIPTYRGKAWELHPLAVHPDHQGKGIGTALVRDIENQVCLRGGITLYLGSDDEDGMTSLANKDLYPDVWKHIRDIRNLKRHPYTFYQRLGFSIVGVIPDANGIGKPDILMAKRLI